MWWILTAAYGCRFLMRILRRVKARKSSFAAI